MTQAYDLICMGRSSIDLFANPPGQPFDEVKQFDAFVGGSPTNICVAAHRLGLKTAMVTGVGDDYVSGFILKFLQAEGIETRYITFKPGYRTNAVMAAVQPPDLMQFVPYSADNADLELSMNDVENVPLTETRALLISGMALIRDPSRSATQYAAEQARFAGKTVFMDLDYRVPMWTDARTYGVTARMTLALVDVAIGTEAEVSAAAGIEDVTSAVVRLLPLVREAVVVKRGEKGCTVYHTDGSIYEVDSFPVDVVNFLGAGDAFAGALIHARLSGADWAQAARFANAAGAYLVAQQGTANAMPTRSELQAFIDAQTDAQADTQGA